MVIKNKILINQIRTWMQRTGLFSIYFSEKLIDFVKTAHISNQKEFVLVHTGSDPIVTNILNAIRDKCYTIRHRSYCDQSILNENPNHIGIVQNGKIFHFIRSFHNGVNRLGQFNIGNLILVV